MRFVLSCSNFVATLRNRTELLHLMRVMEHLAPRPHFKTPYSLHLSVCRREDFDASLFRDFTSYTVCIQGWELNPGLPYQYEALALSYLDIFIAHPLGNDPRTSTLTGSCSTN